ncbi:MAG: acyl-ACP--UDP-N-acetylglucosamine O-acyltransferase [Deltaproteobacteria bacterium]|nr:acyl-ACP--UDP-N-acetylglucosamine O-acyltransferase [Deltaproteobacteria bacterium]
MKKNLIHATAIVDSKAKLGKGVQVGPYSIIGEQVVIQDYTVIENHVTIKGDTVIGKNNSIGPYVSIGLPAQDKAHRNEDTKVIIGDDNEIREYVSIQKGTLGGTGITQIGSHNQIMVYAHFAHDTSVGDNCMFANATTLGGHVQMGSNIVTGGLSAFHQKCKVGDYAMVGGLSAAYQDVPPYVLCTGTRAKLFGINRIGLKRNGFTPEEIHQVDQIYNIFFCRQLVPSKALEVLKKELEDNEISRRFANFVMNSTRGLVGR